MVREGIIGMKKECLTVIKGRKIKYGFVFVRFYYLGRKKKKKKRDK